MRYKHRVRVEEPQLRKRIRELVRARPRFGYRATHANHGWSWDYVFDRKESGQTLKWFVIIDEFTGRCITLDVLCGLKSTDIADRLSELFVMYGMPEHIRSDNGPEFLANEIRDWLNKLGVKTHYIDPGYPCLIPTSLYCFRSGCSSAPAAQRHFTYSRYLNKTLITPGPETGAPYPQFLR